VKPHYPRIRRVKTHSGSIAIQVGFYKGKNFLLKKHIGSAKNTAKITELISLAEEYIPSRSPQLEFNFNPQSEEILFKRGVQVKRSVLQEAYDYLDSVYGSLGLKYLRCPILKHFAMMRVLEPASKIKSISLLNKYFGIHYSKTTAFRELAKLPALKEEVVKAALSYAQAYLHFDFSLIFYDVTTLYYEVSSGDEFRAKGFSKDSKAGQPQILIGLVVNRHGFPVYYDIFKGNTFEGKTIIPIILGIREKYHISSFAVIADAAMLSEKNLIELKALGIDYIVGGRTGQLTLSQVRQIADSLNKVNHKVIRIGETIYEYSAKRAAKDKVDNDKQLQKALYLLSHPGKVFKRSVFLTNHGRREFRLNETLVEKHRRLEGIKLYRTNITQMPEKLLVDRYHDLWKVEQAFRIAKSDLEARPIYHRKRESIEYHILIVFVALCMGKIIELTQGRTLQRVVDELKDKWTVTLYDEISGNSLDITLEHKPH
jgi:transposase